MKALAFILSFLSTVAFGAGKDFVPGFTLINAASMAGNVTSVWVNTQGWDNIDFTAVATGTPTGSFFIDCTINNPNVVTPVPVALGITPTPGVTGSASNVLIEINQTGCMFMRLRYVESSGTGTLTVYASEKQV